MTARKTPVKGSTTVVPASAKKPTDHKPKDEKPTVTKVDGGREVTYHGFSVVVADVALDDFELMGDIRAMQDSNDPSYFPPLLRRLVGESGYRTVMDGLRDAETGRVGIEAGSGYVQRLFEALAPNS